MQNDASTPEWMPTARQGVQVLPVGKWFDAVVMPRYCGAFTLARMRRGGSGAILQADDMWTWLVAPGATSGWDVAGRGTAWDARGIVLLGEGDVLEVPPADQTAGPGPRWLSRPPGDPLTDAEQLHTALLDVLRDHPDRESRGVRRG